jgi:MoxR-like ATPase
VARKAVDDAFEAVYNNAAIKAFEMLGAETSAVYRGLMDKTDNHVAAMQAVVVDTVNQELHKFCEDAMAVARSVQKKVIEVRSESSSVVIDEVVNEAFEEVVELLMAGENVFLPGPAGCGKTHLAQQAARAMGLDFGMISGSGGATESMILGTSVPNLTTGEDVYIPSRFVEVFEQGGLFLVDEADGMDPNVLLCLNSAIAGGFISLPKRRVKPLAQRNPRFCCIFAANTFGRGADRMYVGRNKLDAATLDRFCGSTVPVTYSPAIEEALCPDRTLLTLLREWRAAIFDARLQRLLTTRFVIAAYKATRRGRPLAYVARKLTLDQGWPLDEASRVIGLEMAKAAGYLV